MLQLINGIIQATIWIFSLIAMVLKWLFSLITSF